MGAKICSFFGISFSFSSDGEDYVLSKWLDGMEKGIYIDIGAHRPIKGSNTFYFWLKGWRGVLVDPIPGNKITWQLLRSGDLIYNCGVVPREKLGQSFYYYYFKNNSDNSTFDPKRVEFLEKNYNRKPTSKSKVELITVLDLMSRAEKSFGNIDEVHLLNIDTEGFEAEIMNDFLLLGIKPWVVCAEDLGRLIDDKESELGLIMKAHNYRLVAKTFLSAIYIRADIIQELPSQILRELTFCNSETL